MKAIETKYKGILFRSRTEARWAVYFDAVGLRWEYEKEGFKLDDGTWYLPDFWLPDVNMWAEVKGDYVNVEEITKCYNLAVGSGCPCLMLNGQPETRSYRAMQAPLSGKYSSASFSVTRYRDSRDPYRLPEIGDECRCSFGGDIVSGCELCRFPDMYQAVAAARAERFGT